MTNSLIKQHKKSIKILKQIQDLENDIKYSSKYLKEKNQPFYNVFKSEYKESIKVSVSKVEKLFTKYEKLQKK